MVSEMQERERDRQTDDPIRREALDSGGKLSTQSQTLIDSEYVVGRKLITI